MKAQDQSLFFLTTPCYYDIPFFQRAYVWGEENWSELFKNLTNKSQNHFLGSIILKNELASPGSVARFSVIDGQQRLTTLSILLRACFDFIQKHAQQFGYSDNIVTTCQVQMENILYVQEGGINKKLYVKINHSHLDKKAFESVINGNMNVDDRWEKYVDLPDDDPTSNIYKAYAYFRNELEDVDQDTLDYLWELLTVDKIRFLVNIDLDTNDDEQAIFDTVNSTGVRLSSADTIKNLLYQRYIEVLRLSNSGTADELAISKYKETWVDAFISDESTNAYWEELRQYGRMKRSNIETFLHSFAVVKGFFNPSEHNMAELPKKYREEISNKNIEQLNIFLDELHDYAGVFEEYFSDENDELEYTDYVSRVFNIFNVLEVSTFYPYLLQQLYMWKKELISEEDLKNRFEDIENYVVLNAICKGSTKNYNNECVQMVQGKRTPREFRESCTYISETDFIDGLRRQTTNKLPTLLLFWVELYRRSIENYDIKRLKYGYTLEHIMPQKWVANWSDVPTYDRECNIVEEDDADSVRSHAIYEIGNMTLLNSKLNTSISNSNFHDKINGKSGKKGVKDLADLKLTREVVDKCTTWDERNIYERTKEIEDYIREIWDASELPEMVLVKNNNEQPERKKIRYSFWEKALPIIREKNNYEAFGAVTPGTNNMVMGATGISGFSIACAANYDLAHVDFCLGKNSPELNKKAFDILLSNKDEIEHNLGVSLEWNRSDDIKSSCVSYSLRGVSITNPNDWERITNFLGEWSYKIRKEMLTYLMEEFKLSTAKKKDPNLIERLLSIAEILKEWTINHPEVNEYPTKCTRKYTRFTTDSMSELFPDLKNSPSGWNTDNHYFYEIRNTAGDYVFIKFVFSSRNMDEDQLKKCNIINDNVSMKQSGESWKWWTAYQTSKVMIPDNLDKATIFEGLDKAFQEVKNREKEIKSWMIDI